VAPCSFTDYSRYQPAENKRNHIVYAARLDQEKNPLLFVEAIAVCAEQLRRDEWKCFLHGSGELEKQVVTRVAELGLEDLITTGAVADLSPVLGESKIFVSIQQTENYPSQVLLEAMASENAVIATDVGETRKMVSKESGVLFSDQTPEGLAKVITQLTQTPDSLREFGRHGRKQALNGFNVEVFAEYIEKVWLDVVEQHPGHKRPTVMALARVIVGTVFEELVRRISRR
jgi:glycosyltransferase involved in cell wall biosynthesis